MSKTRKLIALRFAVPTLLIFIATALPLYFLASKVAHAKPARPPASAPKSSNVANQNGQAPAAPALTPAPAISGPVAAAPVSTLPPVVQPSESHLPETTIEALADFYQTVITLLIALLAAVAGLAYWTVKLVSEAKAEEIARSAVRSAMKDSREFHQSLEEAVQEAIDDALDEIRDQIGSLTEEVRSLTEAMKSDEEDVAETKIEGEE